VHSFCSIVNEFPELSSRICRNSDASSLLPVVGGKLMLIPGSSDPPTIFLTSCKCIRPSVADVVAITGLGLLSLFAWALGIHDLP